MTLAGEGKVALATLVNTRGTTPRKEGAKMLVGEGGRVLGSVTIGGCVDAQVIEESADVLTTNAPRLLELDLGDEEAWEIGLTCGGTIEVFVEPVTLDQTGRDRCAFYERARAHAEAGGRGRGRHPPRRPTAPSSCSRRRHRRGHPRRSRSSTDRFVAEAQEAMRPGKSRTLFLEGVRVFVEVIARRPPSWLWSAPATWPCRSSTLARALGFRTIVIDGRPRFATPRALPRRGRPPDRHSLRAGPGRPARSPRPRWCWWPTTTSTTCPCCGTPSARRWATSGCSARSRRGAAILNLLREDGVAEDALSRVRVPIGLDLGAQSRAGDRAGSAGRDAGRAAGRHRDADQREGQRRRLK